MLHPTFGNDDGLNRVRDLAAGFVGGKIRASMLNADQYSLSYLKGIDVGCLEVFSVRVMGNLVAIEHNIPVKEAGAPPHFDTVICEKLREQGLCLIGAYGGRVYPILQGRNVEFHHVVTIFTKAEFDKACGGSEGGSDDVPSGIFSVIDRPANNVNYGDELLSVAGL